MTRSPAHDAEITGTPPTIPAALARAAEKWPDDEALVEGSVRLCFGETRCGGNLGTVAFQGGGGW